MHVKIVGAGIGGLAAAARLARMGYRVEVFEKNASAGGKAAERRERTAAGEFRWDCGPSLVTMPEVLRELFEFCGERMEDHISLRRVEPACRYFWTDGTRIDEDGAFWGREDVARYLARARGIYDLSAEAFLHHAPGDWWRALGAKGFAALRHLPKVATLRSLASLHARYFRDPHIRQIFDRFATYNGSSPYRTPATFAIIPYVEAEFGAWYPEGGIARIPRAIEALARRQGAEFRFGHEVFDLLAVGGDAVLCNADAITAHAHWLPDARRARRLQREDLACSGFVMWLGVRGRSDALSHHNIFFSDDYPGEFREIFGERRMPSEPTIYVAITSRAQPGDAPEGCENWFVLVNAPAYCNADTRGYEEVILRRLAKFGAAPDPSRILCRASFGPADFRRRDNAWEGSLYGWASHSPRTALLRPPIRHPRHRRLFFCGGTTHPGGGIPLVLLSGKIVAEQIRRALCRR